MQRRRKDEDKEYKKYLQRKKQEKDSVTKESLLKKLAEERKKRLALIQKKERSKQEKEDVVEEEKPSGEDLETEPSEEKISEDPKPKKIIKKTEDKDKRSSRDLLKEKIADLEKQISKTKYNKKTQHAIGLMKAQVANLKQKLSAGKGKGGSSSHGYSVKKSGDATVVLLGFPSAGKSTLQNVITGTESEVGAYAFTTLTVIPGMLDYKHAKIQILDVPGIVEGAAAGTGRGKEVLQVIRTADLVLMLLDATQPQQYDKILKEVYDSNIRINRRKPDVKIRRTIKDGIRIGRTVETPELDDETVEGILKQFRIINAEVLIRTPINSDQLIDVIEDNKVYIPAITAINKTDLLDSTSKKKLEEKYSPEIFISAQMNQGVDELKDLIFDKLNFIRIFLKEINKKADMEEPMIMQKGATLKSLCEKLHKDFVEKFQYARIWGPSAKFDGQKLIKLDHELSDEDIVEIHLR